MNGLVCNQQIYDAIYAQIIRGALVSALTEKEIKERNAAIENLRALCNGQLSTYETGKK